MMNQATRSIYELINTDALGYFPPFLPGFGIKLHCSMKPPIHASSESESDSCLGRGYAQCMLIVVLARLCTR